MKLLIQTMLWSKPFSKLKHSCDDGSSQLNLEFGKHGSDAIELLVGVLLCDIYIK